MLEIPGVCSRQVSLCIACDLGLIVYIPPHDQNAQSLRRQLRLVSGMIEETRSDGFQCAGPFEEALEWRSVGAASSRPLQTVQADAFDNQGPSRWLLRSQKPHHQCIEVLKSSTHTYFLDSHRALD